MSAWYLMCVTVHDVQGPTLQILFLLLRTLVLSIIIIIMGNFGEVFELLHYLHLHKVSLVPDTLGVDLLRALLKSAIISHPMQQKKLQYFCTRLERLYGLLLING